MSTKAPYGTWDSPLAADEISGDVNRFIDLEMDKEDIYWVETRPSEEGRFVIMKQSPNKAPITILPHGFSARTRVHEYGGSAFGVHDEVVYFSNDLSGVYKIEPGKAPVKINTPDKVRFAEFKVTPNGIICIAESHQDKNVKNFIARVNPDTGECQTLVEGNDFYSSIAISTDLKKIAWVCWDHPDMPWTNTQLWVGDLTEKGVENKIQIDPDYKDQAFFQPQWGPEGELIVSTDKNEWWNLYRVTAKNQLEQLFEVKAEIGEPLWRLGASKYAFYKGGILYGLRKNNTTEFFLWKDRSSHPFSIDYSGFTHLRVRGDTVACFGSSSTKPNAVLRITEKEQQVVHTNTSLKFDEAFLSEAQAITFESHGREAHAFYYPPKNKNFEGMPGTKPPLVVMSHGGPTSNCGSGFDPVKQYYTSRGFAVVDVNYGGSTGYGRRYRKLLDGQWGIVDVEDCEAAALYLVAKGLADPTKLAITGGSAGGYTTLAALTFKKTFQVGSSHYGVSDCAALAEDTHKFEARYLDNLIAPYPKGKKVYDERSPIHHTDKISCPIIFFQGEEDKIVPTEQASKMHEALKQKGIKTELFVFPGEQHGFRIKANKIAALENECRFFKEVFKLVN